MYNVQHYQVNKSENSSMGRIIKLFIVDDNLFFSNNIKEFFRNNPSVEIIGEAANGKEFLDQIKSIQPDIILMDIFMPVMDGIEASKTRLNQFPEEKIIALSIHVGPVYTNRILEIGMKGCVLKENMFQELLPAIKTVMNGGYFFRGFPTNEKPLTSGDTINKKITN